MNTAAPLVLILQYASAVPLAEHKSWQYTQPEFPEEPKYRLWFKEQTLCPYIIAPKILPNCHVSVPKKELPEEDPGSNGINPGFDVYFFS